MSRREEYESMWHALKQWLRDAKGRNYLRVSPATVLQEMQDLEGEIQ